MFINTFFIIIVFISMKSTTHQVSTSPGIPYQLFVWGFFLHLQLSSLLILQLQGSSKRT